MVQQINVKAIKVGNHGWYKCNLCGDMFMPIVHFTSWDFYNCLPRVCPNCGHKFSNGMSEV